LDEPLEKSAITLTHTLGEIDNMDRETLVVYRKLKELEEKVEFVMRSIEMAQKVGLVEPRVVKRSLWDLYHAAKAHFRDKKAIEASAEVN